MLKVPTLNMFFLIAALVSSAVQAADDNGGGGAGGAYCTRCEIPFPDEFEFHYHFDSQNYMTLAEAITHCKERAPLDLPFHWRGANFTIAGFGGAPPATSSRSFSCRACVRYENNPGPLNGNDLYSIAPATVGDSIAAAEALYGGRVSQVEFFLAIDPEQSEIGGGFEMTLVNVVEGRAGVVRVDPFTGQATVIRDEEFSQD